MLELGGRYLRRTYGGTLLQTILVKPGSAAILLLENKETSDNVLITDELRHDLIVFMISQFVTVSCGRNSGLSEHSS